MVKKYQPIWAACEEGTSHPDHVAFLSSGKRMLQKLATSATPSFLQRRMRSSSSKAQRLHATSYLDGLRGVASFVVFMGHYTEENIVCARIPRLVPEYLLIQSIGMVDRTLRLIRRWSPLVASTITFRASLVFRQTNGPYLLYNIRLRPCLQTHQANTRPTIRSFSIHPLFFCFPQSSPPLPPVIHYFIHHGSSSLLWPLHHTLCFPPLLPLRPNNTLVGNLLVPCANILVLGRSFDTPTTLQPRTMDDSRGIRTISPTIPRHPWPLPLCYKYAAHPLSRHNRFLFLLCGVTRR